MDEEQRKEIERIHKRQDREQLPGLICSIALMIMGLLGIVWLILTSTPKPG